MVNIQEHADQKFSNKSINMFRLDGDGLNLEGKSLVIENYPNVKYLCIKNVPCLTNLIIKDCKQLLEIELYTNTKIEVDLKGEFPELNNWKIFNTQKPAIINTPKEEKCGWKCIFDGFILLWNIGLTVWLIFYLKNRQRKQNKK